MALSEKALSILTFAAYHRLASGMIVRDVVLEDGAGHKADADGVAEMEQAGLLEVNGTRGTLTDQGEAMLGKVVEAIKGVG
jgi:coproporphyrinogen III oxidase-like Fe-S oxidoreductase